jgi:hypothetical protein
MHEVSVNRTLKWKTSARLGILMALCLGLVACSRLSAASGSEPTIPEGQCIMSGISTREDPDLGTQAQAILQARGVNVSAVVGAGRGEASACNRGGHVVPSFAVMTRLVGITVPVQTLDDETVLGERAKQVATALQLAAGENGPLKLGEISLHFSAGDPNKERLVRMSSAKVKAAETQGLAGADFLNAVDGI